MRCEALKEVMDGLSYCRETNFGARVLTHCLYPSYSQVSVFVAKFGDGFRAHDGGEAVREAWLHGRDEKLIASCLKTEVARHHLRLDDGSIVASAEAIDWLPAAVLAVANASAAAALAAVDKFVAAAEESLSERIHAALSEVFGRANIAQDFALRGKSGKEHRFDLAILHRGKSQIVIDAVSPHASSIASKYVAFADTDAPEGVSNFHKFAVFERPLSHDDVSLMQQVAEIVPFAALAEGSRRVLNG